MYGVVQIKELDSAFARPLVAKKMRLLPRLVSVRTARGCGAFRKPPVKCSPLNASQRGGRSCLGSAIE